MRRWGLPEPVPQLEIHDDEGFIARVDFAWPDERVTHQALEETPGTVRLTLERALLDRPSTAGRE